MNINNHFSHLKVDTSFMLIPNQTKLTYLGNDSPLTSIQEQPYNQITHDPIILNSYSPFGEKAIYKCRNIALIKSDILSHGQGKGNSSGYNKQDHNMHDNNSSSSSSNSNNDNVNTSPFMSNLVNIVNIVKSGTDAIKNSPILHHHKRSNSNSNNNNSISNNNNNGNSNSDTHHLHQQDNDITSIMINFDPSQKLKMVYLRDTNSFMYINTNTNQLQIINANQFYNLYVDNGKGVVKFKPSDDKNYLSTWMSLEMGESFQLQTYANNNDINPNTIQ